MTAAAHFYIDNAAQKINIWARNFIDWFKMEEGMYKVFQGVCEYIAWKDLRWENTIKLH